MTRVATKPILIASLLYFLAVFGVGFLLGPIRVFWLEPRIGPVWATLCESPFLLAAMRAAARWAPRVAALEPAAQALALVGLFALLLTQIAEFAVGSALRGLTFTEQLSRFATTPGIIYAVLLVIFTAMPVLANRHTDR